MKRLQPNKRMKRLLDFLKNLPQPAPTIAAFLELVSEKKCAIAMVIATFAGFAAMNAMVYFQWVTWGPWINYQVIPENHVDSILEIAQKQLDEERFSSAMAIANLAIALDDENWQSYQIRGRSRKLSGDLPESIDDYKKVIALDTKQRLRHGAHLSIIESYIFLRDYQSALDWINQHESKILDEDTRTLFKLFRLICLILQLKEYGNEYNEYILHVEKNPLSNHFTRIWQLKPLLEFIDGMKLQKKMKHDLKNVIDKTQQ